MAPPVAEAMNELGNIVELSGVDVTKYDNPYDAIIEVCHNDPVSTGSVPSSLVEILILLGANLIHLFHSSNRPQCATAG